jgi:hypothetical protein
VIPFDILCCQYSSFQTKKENPKDIHLYTIQKEFKKPVNILKTLSSGKNDKANIFFKNFSSTYRLFCIHCSFYLFEVYATMLAKNEKNCP